MPRKTKEQNNSEKKEGLLKSLLSIRKDKEAKKDDAKTTKRISSLKKDDVKESKKKATSKKDDKKTTKKKTDLKAADIQDAKKKSTSKKDDIKDSKKKATSKKDDLKDSKKKAASQKDDVKESKKKISSKKDDLKTTKKKADLKEDEKKDSKKNVSSKKTVKKEVVKESTAKKETKSTSKKVATPKESKVEVKSTKAKTNNTSTSSKKVKSSEKKSSSSSRSTNLEVFSPEYYDLPYRYNQTVVKILAQTPKNLFIYWDISDKDRNSLISKFGEHFFEITKPVLIVHNQTMNYSFEVDVNDFTNSWYLSINDSNCKYSIELGRRPIPINYNYIQNYNKETDEPIKPVETPYIYISSSNDLEAPNDKILYNQNVRKLYFKNVKTNQIIEKDISEFPFIYKDGEFVGIYGIYSNLFKDEEILDEDFMINNPSSGNPGSGSLSSRFK